MSRMLYQLAPKPTYMNQLIMLPRADAQKVTKKVELLQAAPAPTAKNKKRLVGQEAPTFRLRCGDYRVVYGIDHEKSLVLLYSVEQRKDIYRKGGEEIAKRAGSGPRQPADGDLDIAEYDPDEEQSIARPTEVTPEQPPGAPTPLLRPVDAEVLTRLRIPVDYHAAFFACATVEALLEVNAPTEWVNRLFDVLTESRLEQIIGEPNLEIQSVEDFLRFYDGDLVGLLIRLDDEQRRFVTWSINGSGPTLIKGGPGTGKTIIALHRIQSLIEALRKNGKDRPRILFTAYNNTLITVATEMLHQLLGEDAKLVDVITADMLARRLAEQAGRVPKYTIDDAQGMASAKRALDKLAGGRPENGTLVQSLSTIGIMYLFDEISNVIVGREHQSIDSYLAEDRTGRGVRLTSTQRQAIWRVHEECEAEAERSQKLTFPQLRRRVAELVRDPTFSTRYDGVVIDEAQDLQPTTLRMLVSLCESKDRLFLTADPNQSTYGSGFRWADVHEDLQFRGRTGVLHTNYRSTKQIMAAAGSYLRGAELETAEDPPNFPRNGRRPRAHCFATRDEQRKELAAFIREASGSLRVGKSGCAVLVPSETTGMDVARWLSENGLPAKFMTRAYVRLDAPQIKVITLKSVKGLEFPVVAIAGLPPNFPGTPPVGAPEDHIRELQQNGQRTLYVAMTRAMDALLVLVPPGGRTLTASTFDTEFWEVTGA